MDSLSRPVSFVRFQIHDTQAAVTGGLLSVTCASTSTR